MVGRKCVIIGHSTYVLHFTSVISNPHLARHLLPNPLVPQVTRGSELWAFCMARSHFLMPGEAWHTWARGMSNLDLGYLRANTFTSQSTKHTLLGHTFTGGIESGRTEQVF